MERLKERLSTALMELARRDGARSRLERRCVGANLDGGKPREVLKRPDWLEEVEMRLR